MSEILRRFEELGGKMVEGYPVFDSPVLKTANGVSYLNRPGVAMFNKPDVSLKPVRGFLAGFDDDLGFENYLDDPDDLPDAAKACKFCGQLCYLALGPGRTWNKDAGKYFDNIKEQAHGSVLAHASYSVLFYGVSRAFTHELVRHAIGCGFSQISQRYVDGSRLRFVAGPENSDPRLQRRFEEWVEAASDEYDERTDLLVRMQDERDPLLTAESKRDMRKKKQQASRRCLPNETEAPICFSYNIRAIRHIIEQRASSHAEIEIRGVFMRLYLGMALLEPQLFSDYVIHDIGDGTFEVSTPYRKV